MCFSCALDAPIAHVQPMEALLSWVLSPFDMTPLVFENVSAFRNKVFLAHLVHFLHQIFLQGPLLPFSNPSHSSFPLPALLPVP